jgi:hypothetical protein
MASITVAEAKAHARIAHTLDDVAVANAIDAAEAELEMRTGWCVNSGTRTQYVAAYPSDGLLALRRQPVTAASIGSTALTLVDIDGLMFATMPGSQTYPCTVTMTVTPSGNGLLKVALLQRVAELVSRRGDDTQAPSSAYWDNICAALGKGIG